MLKAVSLDLQSGFGYFHLPVLRKKMIPWASLERTGSPCGLETDSPAWIWWGRYGPFLHPKRTQARCSAQKQHPFTAHFLPVLLLDAGTWSSWGRVCPLVSLLHTLTWKVILLIIFWRTNVVLVQDEVQKHSGECNPVGLKTMVLWESWNLHPFELKSIPQWINVLLFLGERERLVS